jgi:hypothetical protein
MAQVKEVIKWLSALDPEEVIALSGWWIQSDVENLVDQKFTEEEWIWITDYHERDTTQPIEYAVAEVME